MPGSCTSREALSTAKTEMLFLVGGVITLVAVAIIPRVRLSGGVNAADLGWMSEQWLAEHRASHSE